MRKIEQNSLILASSSSIRLDLLNKMGINPSIIIDPDINEDILKKEKPYEYVKRMAFSKAMKVYVDYPSTYVLSADTVVIKGTRYLLKATSKKEAYQAIKLISGSKHKVLTSICIFSPEGKKHLSVIKTHVAIKRLTDHEINWYLNQNEWQGKAGSYSIQGVFEMFIKQINGSISAVAGLPLLRTYNALQGLGYKVL